MKTSPEFFKPIPTDLENGLKIPTFFSRHILGTTKHFSGKALLKKKNGQEWRVSVRNGYFAGRGWARFADENNLEPGDLVVFKHRGNLVFHVTVFNGITQCRVDEHLAVTERPSKRSRFEPETDQKFFPAEVSNSNVPVQSNGFPYYSSVIRSYSVGRNCSMFIPMKFARPNGLCEKPKMILENRNGSAWAVSLRFYEGRGLCILGGWKNFAQENGLGEGDAFRFEIVENGEVPVVRFTLVSSE